MIDVLKWCEDELRSQRALNAKGYDRATALAELRGLLTDYATRLNQIHLAPEQMHAGPANEEERARLGSLLDRLNPDKEQHR